MHLFSSSYEQLWHYDHWGIVKKETKQDSATPQQLDIAFVYDDNFLIELGCKYDLRCDSMTAQRRDVVDAVDVVDVTLSTSFLRKEMTECGKPDGCTFPRLWSDPDSAMSAAQRRPRTVLHSNVQCLLRSNHTRIVFYGFDCNVQYFNHKLDSNLLYFLHCSRKHPALPAIEIPLWSGQFD